MERRVEGYSLTRVEQSCSSLAVGCGLQLPYLEAGRRGEPARGFFFPPSEGRNIVSWSLLRAPWHGGPPFEERE